jgi:protein-S-isoprenylcysteine O-methyltransferase Ste14
VTHKRKPLPPTYLVVALVAIVALHLLLPGPRVVGSPWRYLGLLPIGLGAWLNLWADGLFKKRGTEVKPFLDSTVLVTDGPYRITRHPMYLGMLLIAIGTALVAGSTTPILVAFGLWWSLTTRFIVPEEAAMRRQFGSGYERYERQVRRWLGRRAG